MTSIPSIDDLTTPDRRIRDAAIRFFESPEFDPYFRVIDRHWRPAILWRVVVAVLTAISQIGIPIAIYQVVRIFQVVLGRSRRRQRFLDKARRSVPIVVAPLMVNSDLLRTPGLTAPGLFMGSFVPHWRQSVVGIRPLMDAILRVEADQVETHEEVEIAAIYKDLAYRPHRRRLMPHGLTDGQDVFAFDVLVVSDFLPHSTFTITALPCLAEPGPEGQIVMIPAELMPAAIITP